jgi:choline monooxygenase
MSLFNVDPDIRKAATLPTNFYTEAEYFEQSKQRIFESSWQWIGDVNSLLSPFDTMCPVSFLEPLLGEPMLLVRDQNGGIQCHSNVCTHRGNILLHQASKEKQILCGYHGRRFGLDGKFKSMPEFQEAENFPRACDDLHTFESFNWDNHIFAGIAAAFDLAPVLDHMKERVGFLPLAEFKLDPLLSRDYLVQSHWALYCDNYLEGFHIPFVHQGLNQQIEYDQYETVLFDYLNLQIGYTKGQGEAFDFPKNHIDYGKEIAAYYFWLFPNMMFNFYPWGLSINVVRPLAKDRTKVSFYAYVYDRNKLDKGAGADLDKVEREDEFVVEGVQKGIQSRYYSTGRFSPTKEKGVHHFHRLIAEFMK